MLLWNTMNYSDQEKFNRFKEHPEEGSWDYKHSKYHALGQTVERLFECLAYKDWGGELRKKKKKGALSWYLGSSVG